MLILSWVNIMKQKSTQVPGKLSVAQRSKPFLRGALDQDISLIMVRFSFSRPSLYSFTQNFRENSSFHVKSEHWAI